jgi:hypothetical protein
MSNQRFTASGGHSRTNREMAAYAVATLEWRRTWRASRQLTETQEAMSR